LFDFIQLLGSGHWGIYEVLANCWIDIYYKRMTFLLRSKIFRNLINTHELIDFID